MKRYVFVILTVELLLAADDPRQAVKEELERLQGEWQLVSVEIDGTKVPEDSFPDETSCIKGDQLTVRRGDKVLLRATMTFDPTADPKTFVETITEGINEGKKYHGIYELKGDTLRSCAVSADQERPKEFTTRNGGRLFVSRRVKP
jgi:uncharacterized protein (TIGR03067 family)